MIYFLRAITLTALLVLLAACNAMSSPKHPVQHNTLVKQALMQHYQSWRGTPYSWGGQSRSGVDCSGFMQLTFWDVLNTKIPRSTKLQSERGQALKRHELQVGDLVFFKPKYKVLHVGVYLGENTFLHASSSQGVTISSLENTYWNKAYWKARRLQ